MGKSELTMHPLETVLRRCIMCPLRSMRKLTIGSRKRFSFSSTSFSIKTLPVAVIRHASQKPLLTGLFLFACVFIYFVYLSVVPMLDIFWLTYIDTSWIYMGEYFRPGGYPNREIFGRKWKQGTGTCREDQQDENRILYQDDLSHQLKKIENLATSGHVFTGEKIRSFPSHKIKFGGKSPALQDVTNRDGSKGSDKKNYQENASHESKNYRRFECKKWGVVTTIFEPPSEAVRRFLYRKEWCLVIVGDKGKPKHYYLDTTMGDRAIFLSEEDQRNMGLTFVDRLPWNSFGRKNVGYLYAISQGAEVIFDFDDDNMLKFWMKDASPDPVMDIDNFGPNGGLGPSIGIYEPKVCPGDTTFNPYPLLGAPSLPCWPRGLPLNRIRDEPLFDEKLNNTNYFSNDGNKINLGRPNFAVLQSLADLQPDVDAIYRLVKKTPFYFLRPEPIQPQILKEVLPSIGNADSRPVLKVPKSLFTPYNAQASLHFLSSFWALYLPVTVPKIISDIWRAYFSQALFPKLNLNVGFLPRPLVIRTKTRDLEEEQHIFQEELALYTKASTLISYLIKTYVNENKKNDTNQKFVVIFEKLWIDMHERGYIEEEDVENIQLWIETLLQIGYEFPHIKQNIQKDTESDTDISGSLSPNAARIRRQINTLGSPINSLPLLQNKCVVKYNLTFANSDLHDGPKIDIPSTLLDMGQRYINVGPKLSDLHKEWNLKGRNPKKNFPNVMRMPGMLFDQDNVSKPLTEYSLQPLDHSTSMSFSNWSLVNTEFYRHDKLISQEVSAFICSFPAAICQIWKEMNKTIIFLTAHRYNLGRCTQKEWKSLDSDIAKWGNSPLNELGHIVGAVSRYDLEYLKYYNPELTAELIPSLGAFYMNVQKHKPSKREEILIFKKLGSHYGAVPYSLPHKKDRFITRIQDTLKPEFKGDIQILHFLREQYESIYYLIKNISLVQ